MNDGRNAVVDRLAHHDRLVEVGVGRRPAVAEALARRGCRVTATDVRHRETPPAVAFVRDDVTDPDPGVYAGADAVFALHCPPELQRPLVQRARDADAACLFTTLGGDPAVVPVERERVAGVTLFHAGGGPG